MLLIARNILIILIFYYLFTNFLGDVVIFINIFKQFFVPISFFNEFSVLLLVFFLVHHCNINENVKCCLAKIFVYTTNLKHDNHKFSAVCPNILLAVYIISLFPTEALRFDHTDINFKRQSHSKPFIFNGDLMQHEQLRLNDFIQIHSDMMQWLPMRVQIVKKNCS